LLTAARRLPIIFLDLKGAAFSKEGVQEIGAAAEELRIEPHVALFVMGPDQEALVAQAGYKGPLIRGYLVREGRGPARGGAGALHRRLLLLLLLCSLAPLLVWHCSAPPPGVGCRASFSRDRLKIPGCTHAYEPLI
jgi:hypothetical protein